MGIIDEIKYNFRHGNILMRLIYINVGLFIIVNLLSLILYLFNLPSIEKWIYTIFYFPSNFNEFLHKPWTLLTYMYMHADIWHILFNMLWLYWLGQIFLLYLSHRQLLSVYLLGGFFGAFLYLLLYNIFPAFELQRFGSAMVGASAAIMAVVIGIATIVPNFIVNLFLFGPVRLKYIAIATIVIDLISIQYSNAGGHIAHLGGAIFGYWFGIQFNKGNDITSTFSKIIFKIPNIFKKKSKIKLMYRRPLNDYEYNANKAEMQKELDRILDKIAKSGYDSLTKKEKEFLFKSGK